MNSKKKLNLKRLSFGGTELSPHPFLQRYFFIETCQVFLLNNSHYLKNSPKPYSDLGGLSGMLMHPRRFFAIIHKILWKVNGYCDFVENQLYAILSKIPHLHSCVNKEQSYYKQSEEEFLLVISGSNGEIECKDEVTKEFCHADGHDFEDIFFSFSFCENVERNFTNYVDRCNYRNNAVEGSVEKRPIHIVVAIQSM